MLGRHYSRESSKKVRIRAFINKVERFSLVVVEKLVDCLHKHSKTELI